MCIEYSHQLKILPWLSYFIFYLKFGREYVQVAKENVVQIPKWAATIAEEFSLTYKYLLEQCQTKKEAKAQMLQFFIGRFGGKVTNVSNALPAC